VKRVLFVVVSPVWWTFMITGAVVTLLGRAIQLPGAFMHDWTLTLLERRPRPDTTGGRR
jgi:hypothetical protein